MGKKFDKVKVAAVQISSISMDAEATAKKVCEYIEKAADEGAQLILFPEVIISGYPWSIRFGVSLGRRDPIGRKAFVRYWNSAIDVPGPITDMIGKAAKKAGSYVVLGVTERDTKFSEGTLYCSVLYFGPDGTLLGKHRKFKPTAAERYVWGEGDGSTMPVFDTEVGRFGALICWENYVPLARMAMYGKGLDLYLAPTADSRDMWLSSMKHIAYEGRCFVISACQYMTKDMYPQELEVIDELDTAPEVLSRGGSVIISPMGEILAGPLYGEEGIVSAELDMTLPVEGRFDLDVAGHYSRPDIFQFTVNEKPRSIVEYINEEN